jgi:DNA-binding FadR family transcriptional regulator
LREGLLRDRLEQIVIAFSHGHTSEKVMQESLQTADSDSRRQVADVVAERIERLIVDGVLKSGHALPSERRLTEKLGVSRTALREGLKLLRRVASSRRRRARVRSSQASRRSRHSRR